MSALAAGELSALRGNQRPGLLHLPSGSDAHVGDAMYLLGEWGFSYDDSQQFVIASSLREQPDGRWSAKEVGLEEPRQNGKGETIEGRECLGLFYLEERKLIHSAHEFATASEALDRMDDRIGQNPTLKQRVKTVKRSHGEEGVYLKDGRSLRYKTRTKGGGRGFGADFLGLDEAMFLAEAFLAALMPVISARWNPQMWYMGSAADQKTMDNAVVFARLRQRALDGKPGRMAYFGWSAAYVDNKVVWGTPAEVPAEATADPVVVARANPALGIRIDLDHVLETEREAMGHETFCVERLGVGDWPATEPGADQVISDAAWDVLRADVERPAEVVFAFDVSPDRQRASVSVSGPRKDGLGWVDLVENGDGTGWVVPRLLELAQRHDPVAIVADSRGPGASLAADLEAAGERAELLNSQEYARACGSFFDDVAQQQFRHAGAAPLRAAVKAAVKRPLGDAWAWDRKSSAADITPLVSATLARWRARDIGGVYEGRGVLSVSLED